MGEFVAKLCSFAGVEPHVPRFLQQFDILWLPVLSDLCMALANYAILLAVLYFVSRRQERICKRAFLMFGACMFFCGTIYLLNIWTLWHRTSPVESLGKFATGALATAALLWCVIPAILRLRAPVQLAQANQALPAEAALRARQAMFTQLFECVPDALILANAAGEIVAVNSQAERLFGYARQELWGQSIELLVPERFPHRHREHREHYMAAPRARAMGEGLALFGRRKGGQEFLVEISLSPLHIAARPFVVSAIRDITEQQRTAEALRQAEHLARLGRLAASVSHDLRNPLASMAVDLHCESSIGLSRAMHVSQHPSISAKCL